MTCPKKSLHFSCLTPLGHMSIDFHAPGGKNSPIIIVLPPGLILGLFFSDFSGFLAPQRRQLYVFLKKDINRHCF